MIVLSHFREIFADSGLSGIRGNSTSGDGGGNCGDSKSHVFNRFDIFPRKIREFCGFRESRKPGKFILWRRRRKNFEINCVDDRSNVVDISTNILRIPVYPENSRIPDFPEFAKITCPVPKSAEIREMRDFRVSRKRDTIHGLTHLFRYLIKI